MRGCINSYILGVGICISMSGSACNSVGWSPMQNMSKAWPPWRELSLGNYAEHNKRCRADSISDTSSLHGLQTASGQKEDNGETNKRLRSWDLKYMKMGLRKRRSRSKKPWNSASQCKSLSSHRQIIFLVTACPHPNHALPDIQR